MTIYSKESLLGTLEWFDNREVFLDDFKEEKMIRNLNLKQREQGNRHVFAKSENILLELVKKLRWALGHDDLTNIRTLGEP